LTGRCFIKTPFPLGKEVICCRISLHTIPTGQVQRSIPSKNSCALVHQIVPFEDQDHLLGGFKLDTTELLRRRRERQEEILKTLKPELYAEYKRFEIEIATLQRMLAEEIREPLEAPSPQSFINLPRVPLMSHKIRLTTFLLGQKEPVSRKAILEATGIPPGSLSSLLQAKEFEQVVRGFWKLKERIK
jgi:hypothetical protein